MCVCVCVSLSPLHMLACLFYVPNCTLCIFKHSFFLKMFFFLSSCKCGCRFCSTGTYASLSECFMRTLVRLGRGVGGGVSACLWCVRVAASVCVMACIIPCHIKPHTVGRLPRPMCAASAGTETHDAVSLSHATAQVRPAVQPRYNVDTHPARACTRPQPLADRSRVINHTDIPSHVLVHKQIYSSLQK